MAIDDRTAAIYSALDPATLLALLPALRYEAERTKDETDTFERVRLVIPEQAAGGTAESVTTGKGGPDEPGAREQTDLARTARGRPAPDGELGNVLERLGRYRAELMGRERWIRNELVRRGLLPPYPYWGER